MCSLKYGPAPTPDSAGNAPPRPLFSGHRDRDAAGDRDLARVPFADVADRVLCAAHELGERLERGGRVLVTGDDSAWAACTLAAYLPDQTILALIDTDGPLGLAGARHWLEASDAPGNLSVVVEGSGDEPCRDDADTTIIDVTALAPGETAGPDTDAAHAASLHALANPDAPVELNRARIGTRLLSDMEVKVLYWASRAASVARTAQRIGCHTGEVIDSLAQLHREGFVRLQRLPAAMARLHVFWMTGQVLLPLAEQTLGHLAGFGLRAFAERVYLRNADDGSSMTCDEAAAIIGRIAAALHRDGVRRGDRVCVHSIPHIEVPLVFWACVHVGAVFVPIGSIWSAEIARGILVRCRPKALFINDQAHDRVPDEWRASAIRLDPAGDTGDPNATEPLFSDWLGDEPRIGATHAGPDDCAVILFTSGTTGVPKGVMLSSAVVAIAGQAAGPAMAMNCEDSLFGVIEPIAAPGLVEYFVTPLICGAALVIPDPARRGGILGHIDIFRTCPVTIYRTFPASLRQLVHSRDRLASDAFGRLRLVYSSAAPLHQETIDRVGAICPTRVMDGLGATELGGTLVFNDPSSQRGSVFAHGGYPHGAVAQTVDDAGEVIRDGGIGSLRILGDRLMNGYLDDPERTAEAVRDGWFYTGDLARWETPGPLMIAGRAVEMIKSAWGDKVFLSEIEAALMADERVYEVAAAAFTDAEHIERIAAFIIPDGASDDPDRLGEDLKQRVRETLGDSKVPSLVVFVDDLPRLARDKVNKRALVETYLPH